MIEKAQAMMGKKLPDFKIETRREMDGYLGLWVDHHVGVRLDYHIAKEVQRKILSEEIPHKREMSRYATVSPNFTIGKVTMYYMLARALGAKYGIHFGHWTDDGKRFYSWELGVQSTLRATNYLLEILLTRVTAKELGIRMLSRLPVMSSEIDKEWKQVIARDSRKNAQELEAIAQELANVEGMSLDDFEEEFYEVELGETLRPRYVNIIMREDSSEEEWPEVEFGEMPTQRDINIIETGFDGVTFLRPVDAAHLAFSGLSAPNDFPQAMRDKAKALVKKWKKMTEEFDG